MEARLDPHRFVRIHRSRIVNTERIKELQPWFNGEYVVLLRNGTRLTLSRGYRDRLQEQLGKIEIPGVLPGPDCDVESDVRPVSIGGILERRVPRPRQMVGQPL